MEDVSYSAHISNGKSAINSKGKLSGVAKHNLRKYRSPKYDRENIVRLFGSTNLMRDVKKPESAKDNNHVYRTHNEEYVWGR